MQARTLRALEFDQIVEVVQGLALTPLGAVELRQLHPLTDPRSAKTTLSTTTARSAAKPSGLSFKEKHELTDLPKRIEVLESKQRTLSDDMANPEFYRQSPDAITRVGLELKQVTTQLAQAYARWEELESRAE